MKPRFTLFRRGQMFYCQDTTSGQQTSLRTNDEGEAHTLLHSKNEAFRQPTLNLQIARTYLSAGDPAIATRPWRVVMEEMGKTKRGATLRRHECAMQDNAFDLIREMPILETQATHFLRVLEAGCVSTNVFLRRLHSSSHSAFAGSLRKESVRRWNYPDEGDGLRLQRGTDASSRAMGRAPFAQSPIRPPRLRAFFFCQCRHTVFVILASQDLSFVNSNTSAVEKYLVPLGGGLPSGRSKRAATRIGTSCV
jgi:hypothetical protein